MSLILALALAPSALASPPANDDFANAENLGGGAHATASGDNREAGTQPGEPDPAGGFATRATVWYTWTAPDGTRATIDVCGADFFSGVAVYTGAAVDSLTLVATDIGNPCHVSFDPTPGTTYRIMVDGLEGETGTFELALDQGVKHTLEVTRSGAGSGTVTGEPAGIDCGATCSHDYGDGITVTLTATPASGSTFAGWSGACLAAFGTCEVTMDQARSVTASFDEASGQSPGNDNFGNAENLGNGVSASASGDNTNATSESGEPEHSGLNVTTGASVWYRWTAPGSGEATVDVCDADFADGVAVYTGSAVNSLNLVVRGSVSKPCRVSFPSTAGTTYRIVVDGLLGQSGAFDLTLDQVNAIPPANTAKPVISGTAKPGATLTCSNGSWSGSTPMTFTRQWLRNGSAIAGKTASTYVVQSSDTGQQIACRVRATNSAASASATSAAVKISTPPANTVKPKITGTARAGATLTCSGGSWSGSTPMTFTRQWLRNGSAIAGKTASTYVVQSDDVGQRIACRVKATNAAGSASATSDAVTIPVRPRALTVPGVTGTGKAGTALTCSNGSWAGSRPMTFTMQWLRNGSMIPGQTGSTYVVQPTDAGRQIGCRVKATNAAGSASATGTLKIPTPPAMVVRPRITGDAEVGGVLGCTDGTWSGSTPMTFTYEWFNGLGERVWTGRAYLLGFDDYLDTLRCRVTATNRAGSQSAYSRRVIIVWPT